MVTVNSGPPAPTDKFSDTAKDRWFLLLIAKRSFLARNLEYDCRCLIEFCEEADQVYAELGFDSPEAMIREGYELEPSQVELAVAWLKANGTETAIGMDAIKAKVAEARQQPLEKHGTNQHIELQAKISAARESPLNQHGGVDNINSTMKGGTGTTYTLRRLARDAPELLDRIEAGELTVNQAAIEAGIRKKLSNAEKAVRAFRLTENRLEPMRAMLDLLEPFELAVIRDWVVERLD